MNARRPRGKPFCSELQNPIYEPRLNALGRAAELMGDDRRAARIAKAQASKVRHLFEHYEVNASSADGWRDLAIRMAVDLVPGFSVVEAQLPRAGRPRGSTPNDNWGLARDIEEFALRRSITQSQACTRLVKLKRSRWKGQDHRALYARYLRHLKSVGREAASVRMGNLRTQLEGAKEMQNQSTVDPIALAMLAEPVFRILRDPNGTNIC